MKFIGITLPEIFKEEANHINVLFEGGLEKLHIRKPYESAQRVKNLLTSIDENHHPRIVIHQHHELANEFDLAGIHLKESLRNEKPGMAAISTSFHSTEALLSCRGDYRYVFLSPVMDSISKPGYKSTFKKEVLKRALRHTDRKVVALGGIKPSHAKELKDLGFWGMASIGSLWTGNSLHNLRKFEKVIREIEN